MDSDLRRSCMYAMYTSALLRSAASCKRPAGCCQVLVHHNAKGAAAIQGVLRACLIRCKYTSYTNSCRDDWCWRLEFGCVM